MTASLGSTATAVAIAVVTLVPSAGAATAPRWSKARCQFQQALFNVRHPHPTRAQLAGGNRTLRAHGCAERVPGPKHWSGTQCVDYQVTFVKLNAFPSDPQLAAANNVLKDHGCSQRIKHPPTQH